MLTVIKQPYNSVLVKASSHKELSLSFMRFQEHYENPFFRNKVFTCGQLKEWYSKKYGGDTYSHDWAGFNFPSSVLIPFRNGLFDPLTKPEQSLLNLFRYRHDNFYIIGAQDDRVLRHELSHALYIYNKEYKYKIDTYFQKHKTSITKAISSLQKKGYHKDVIYDELQAYITDNDDNFVIKVLSPKVIQDIALIYRKYK